MFSPDDFRDLGKPSTIGMALLRFVRQRTIRRIARGLYDYPKTHPVMNLLTPRPEAIAKALTARYGIRLQPSGAYAANLLGLSEQVPAVIVFLTDGPSRTVQVGTQKINLQHTTPRNMRTAGSTSGLVIQALRHIGRKQVNGQMLQKLRQKLSIKDRQRLSRDSGNAPAWMAPYLRAIAADKD